MTGFTAVVLAATRPGDPVALAQGVSHKALVPVAGVPMIERVVTALRASDAVERITICIDDPAPLQALPALAEGVGWIASAATPSTSVLHAATELPLPLLVTTADHALLSPAMVDFFAGAARRTAADVAVGLAPASVILRDYPDAVRTFLRFRDDRYSGCNLFALLGPKALNAVRFWVDAERYRKQPWKLAARFGPVSLALFAAGRLTLEDGMRRASRAVGADAQAVVMPFAEAAIDVDKPADLALAEAILARRAVSR